MAELIFKTGVDRPRSIHRPRAPTVEFTKPMAPHPYHPELFPDNHWPLALPHERLEYGSAKKTKAESRRERRRVRKAQRAASR